MGQGLLQIGLTLCIIIAISPLLGRYIYSVYIGRKSLLDPLINPLEKIIFFLAGVSKKDSMNAWQYIRAVLATNLCMGIVVYLLLINQKILPWNPTKLGIVKWDLVLHTTISFLTNTNLQHYGGENTFSYFSQIAALGFLMFTSAATGLAVGIAVIRGLTGKPLGNFYLDITRGITRILLPISIVGAIALISLRVPQTLSAPMVVNTLEGETQYIARGPVASFEMIKMLGNNGGGFFAANSAHPFENPNGASNLIEIIAMVAIPAALIHTYGFFANNRKQAWLLFWMVFMIFLVLLGITVAGEYRGNPLINNLLTEAVPNLEGKEVRFGWAQTALWAVISTATMCGAINGINDSLMPNGSFATLSNLFLQSVWGGIGTGIIHLLIYLIMAMFLAGLMVGRTPSFLGKKIEQREILLVSLVLLIHPMIVLIPSAIALLNHVPLSGITNPDFHGFSQVIYEYAAASANNGSTSPGLSNNNLWWNLSTAFSMLLGRYVPIIAILLVAESMAQKPLVPKSIDSLRTDSLLFTSFTVGIMLILTALIFFPVMILGPVAEGLKLAAGT
ncbi:potassium-transporting ATPase subunit KdpA [Calothrix rhizosoleniae]|uniref:potassium-transporting ATPase subunit KdpA n=1 Tax=Calothrix rhizosoleniae TaxID=888997 RepID=UPI000B49B01B|nr:potassium-transporting ATPase subunit KdpA [Calothrix rhizosoleniae]